MKTITCLKSKTQTPKITILISIFLCLFFEIGFAQTPTETAKLLSRLDLTKPGIKKVKLSSNKPEQVATELLNYFRDRISVKHFIDRNSKKAALGNTATEKDFEAADNALKHIFIRQSDYPTYFCDDDINWGTRPVPENERVWQLNRMGFWKSMAKVYWQTSDEKYPKKWCFLLIDWTRKYPRDKEHEYA